MMKSLFSLLFALVLLGPVQASAEAESVPLPGDAKLVMFTFDEHNTYTIMTMPGNITDINLMDDEKLVVFALGDSVQWITAKTDGHVFVKPIKPNIYTSGTLVTNKRSYQLMLRASPQGGKWYQRVSWNYPEIIVQKQQQEDARVQADRTAQALMHAEEAKRKAEAISTTVSKAPGNPVANLNFDYGVKGEAEFKPLQVFDDGKFTWLKISSKAQEMPALFILGADGTYELVNYVRDGDYLKVNRLFKACVLKIGNIEIKVNNNSYAGTTGSIAQQENGNTGFMPWPTNN